MSSAADERRVTGLVVAISAAFCAGVAASLLRDLPPSTAAATMFVAAAVAMLSTVHAGRVLPVGALVLVALAGGVLRGGVAHLPAPVAAHRGATTAAGVVRDAPVPRRSATQLVIVLDRDGETVLADVQGASSLLPGDRVQLQVAALRDPAAEPIATASTAARVGADAVAVSPRVTLVAPGRAGPMRLLAEARAALGGAVAHELGEPTASLVDEIALGLRPGLPAEVRQPLQDSGLAHLLATSGLKVAVMAGIIGRLLLLAGVSPRWRRLGLISGIAAYVVMAGGGAAAVRSALAAGLAAGLAGSGRRVNPIRLLAVLAGGVLAVDPRQCLDLGFQLTYLGTAGILLLAPALAGVIRGPSVVVEPFTVTVAAQAATLPITAATFGVVALGGPVANVLVLPLLPPLLVAGWTGAALSAVHPSAGALPLWVAGTLVSAVVGVGRAVAAIPGAALYVGAGPSTAVTVAAVAAVALMLALPRRPPSPTVRPARPRIRVSATATAVAAATACSGVVVALAAAVVSAHPDGHLHLTVMAPGAGAAVLVRTPSGSLALVDAGGDPASLATAVGTTLGPLEHTVDLVVLTGGSRAEAGGLAAFSGGRLRAGHVIVCSGPLGVPASTALDDLAGAGTAVQGVRAPSTWTWGGVAWSLIPAASPERDLAAPPLCALRVSAVDGSALLLGGIALAEQDDLAATIGGHVDVVVGAPRQGVAASLIDAVGPGLVVLPDRSPARPAAGPRVRTLSAGPVALDGGPRGLGTP